MFCEQVFWRTRRICLKVAVSSTDTKKFFIKKKKIPSSDAQKLTTNNEQYIRALALFLRTIFCAAKKWFRPIFVVFANSVERALGFLNS